VAAVEVDGSEDYWKIRSAVREALRKHFAENMGDKLKAAQLTGWESGARCLDRILEVKV